MTNTSYTPALLDYFCSDLDNVDSWRPEDGRVDYWLQLDIGAAGGEAADIFQVRVVDAVTLAGEAPTAIRSTVVVGLATYSFDGVKQALETTIESCTRSTWAKCAAALNRWFHWEYEDHRWVDDDTWTELQLKFATLTSLGG